LTRRRNQAARGVQRNRRQAEHEVRSQLKSARADAERLASEVQAGTEDFVRRLESQASELG
jgi:F0F1-type ATP synthase membrane subunit b/b'